MTSDRAQSPSSGGLPEAVVETLEALDDHDLRRAILYAQALLRRRHGDQADIEAGPGEEIVRVVEHEGFTEVHKLQPCPSGCDDCPHGPYVYHVVSERHPDGTEHRRWTLIGEEHHEP
ncbi:hypothetical protein ACFQPA_07720 [Halomarina halobia]|uniref:Uncharacterized protein n=1 Tax=Halomarina halobia TaxID=3033386 RepID=A0ABD6ACV2_9EURY|nr:hypothetical protein [Halomarina sp. PSR21]